jgi:heme iron utilization protein
MIGIEEVRDMALCGRRLLRRCGRAALATSLLGAPYASLVLCAVDGDASPLLFLSDLAQHSRNIAFDPRISLLFDGAAGARESLSGPRLSLLGRVEANADRRLLHRFIARHPASEVQAGFADFKLYRVAVERGHLVAGFGRIAWIDGSDLLFRRDGGAVVAAEPAILAELNGGLSETLARAVARRLGRQGADWRACGCDPEGLDLRRGDSLARLDFAAPIATAAEVPRALAALARPANNLKIS